MKRPVAAALGVAVLVASLVGGHVTAGEKETHWDVTGVCASSSEVYFREFGFFWSKAQMDEGLAGWGQRCDARLDGKLHTLVIKLEIDTIIPLP
jgi:hypothetical protein